MDHLISARRLDIVIVKKKQKQKKKQQQKNKTRLRTCRIVDSAVSTDYRVKLKESEKRNKYQDLARELKNY